TSSSPGPATAGRTGTSRASSPSGTTPTARPTGASSRSTPTPPATSTAPRRAWTWPVLSSSPGRGGRTTTGALAGASWPPPAAGVELAGHFVIPWTGCPNQEGALSGVFMALFGGGGSPPPPPPPPQTIIGDRVWNDANNNGIQDAGEQGLANVTVKLFDQFG